MCRLAFCSADYLSKYSVEEITLFFKTLERELGGHGIGAAYHLPGRKIVACKSQVMTPRDAANFWLAGLERGAKEFLFHTRLVSAGPQCDSLCHPFVNGTSALAHNGHDSRYVIPGWPTSDTSIIAESLWRGYLTVDKLNTCSGTFVGWYKGMAFAQSKAGYDCELTFASDTAWLIASRIPLQFQEQEYYRADGYSWDATKSTIPTVPLKLAKEYLSLKDFESTGYTDKAGKWIKYSDLDFEEEYDEQDTYPVHTYKGALGSASYYIDAQGKYHELYLGEEVTK